MCQLRAHVRSVQALRLGRHEGRTTPPCLLGAVHELRLRRQDGIATWNGVPEVMKALGDKRKEADLMKVIEADASAQRTVKVRQDDIAPTGKRRRKSPQPMLGETHQFCRYQYRVFQLRAWHRDLTSIAPWLSCEVGRSLLLVYEDTRTVLTEPRAIAT
jgi:hypothetical protein